MRDKKVLFWLLLDRSQRFVWSGKLGDGKFVVESMRSLADGLDLHEIKRFATREDAILAAHGLKKRNLVVLPTPARLG
jgi:hypothetical protein